MKSLTTHAGLTILAVRLSMPSKFRRLVLSALIGALAVSIVPSVAAPVPAGQQPTGLVAGSARSASGQGMPNVTVRLRNLQTGQFAGETMAGADGSFSFAGLGPGNYAVEVLNAEGAVIGTSSSISLTTTAMTATNLVVSTSAVARTAAVAAAAGGSFFTSTLGVVTVAAIGAGVAGTIVVATNGAASPSR
jgi:Carboxypeptidase regulatory-like domain